MKKRQFDYRYLVGIVAGISVLSGAVVGLSKYIQLPDRVEAVEKTTNQIADYIKEQQIYNKAVQTILTNQPPNEVKEEEIILSPDKKWWYDKQKEKWRSISELPK